MTLSRLRIEKKLLRVYKVEPGGWTSDHYLSWNATTRDRDLNINNNTTFWEGTESYQLYFDWASKLHKTAFHVHCEKINAENQKWGDLDGVKISEVKELITGYTSR